MTTKFTKKIKEYNYYSGLNAQETFELEKECLTRLKGYTNFPQIISSNQTNKTITMTHCGKSLLYLSFLNISKENALKQIMSIAEALDKTHITHLDIMAKNMCYKNGTIYLIDFDISVLDYTPMTTKLQERYRKVNHVEKLKKIVYSKLKK